MHTPHLGHLGLKIVAIAITMFVVSVILMH